MALRVRACVLKIEITSFSRVPSAHLNLSVEKRGGEKGREKKRKKERGREEERKERREAGE